MAKITLKNIKDEVDKVEGIKTQIEALEKLVGKHDDSAGNDHSGDTGIYKVIYNNFTDLMGGP